MDKGTTSVRYQGKTFEVGLQGKEEPSRSYSEIQVQVSCTKVVFGQDYTDTYSSIAKFASIRTLLAITAQLDLKVHQMDVDTAFLNAPIYEDIWVKVPDGTPLANGDTGIYKLRKALYGLKQAPREWNYHVDKFLVTKLGFRRLEADPCIYKKTVLKEVNGVVKEQNALIALYVDDLGVQIIY